jgi:hypothetical protein
VCGYCFLVNWKIVVVYAIGSLVATFFLGFLCCRVHGFPKLSRDYCNKVGVFFAWILVSANVIWCVLIIAGWCLGMFSELTSLHETGPLLPYLLFAYGVSSGPWTYLASQDTEGSMLIVFFALLGLVAMMIVQEFALPISTSLAFWLPMAGGALIQIIMGLFVLRTMPVKEPLA